MRYPYKRKQHTKVQNLETVAYWGTKSTARHNWNIGKVWGVMNEMDVVCKG